MLDPVGNSEDAQFSRLVAYICDLTSIGALGAVTKLVASWYMVVMYMILNVLSL